MRYKASSPSKVGVARHKVAEWRLQFVPAVPTVMWEVAILGGLSPTRRLLVSYYEDNILTGYPFDSGRPNL